MKDAKRHRIHVFLATSAIHREHKLRMTAEEVAQRAVEGVKRARDRCEYCQLSQLGREATFHIDHVVPRSAGGSRMDRST